MSMDRRDFLSSATLGAGAVLSSQVSVPSSAAAADNRSVNSAAAPAIFYAGPTPDVPQVGLRWAFSATVFFADRVMIDSPNPRGYTSVGGGEIWGPRLQGRVLPHSGADYYRGTFNTYYMLEASDGALIFIHNRGTVRRFEEPPQPGRPLIPATAETKSPVWVRFRATPVFTAPTGPHDWLNRTVFVAHLQRQEHPDHSVFTYYEVL